LEAIVEVGGTLAYLKLAVIVIAVVAQVWWFARDSTRRVNAAEFSHQVSRLVASNNVERAIKLSHAARSPLTEVARIGLKARLEGKSPRDAMNAVLPLALASARSGLVAALAVSALGFVEAGALLAKGMEEGSGEGVDVFMGLALVVIGGLAIRNGLRWGACRVELDQVADAVAK
jgi:hypothetical protein